MLEVASLNLKDVSVVRFQEMNRWVLTRLVRFKQHSVPCAGLVSGCCPSLRHCCRRIIDFSSVGIAQPPVLEPAETVASLTIPFQAHSVSSRRHPL